MSLPPTIAAGRDPFSIEPKRLHDHWKSILVFGAIASTLSVLALALTVSATIASVLLIGIFMLFTGAAEIVVGFRPRSWGRFIVWELAGLLYTLAGGFAILVPEIASVVITLLLGAGPIATAVLRIVFGAQIGASARRGTLLLSGVITAPLGAFIVLGWSGNSALILGTLLGIDLLFNGLARVVFGLRARTTA